MHSYEQWQALREHVEVLSHDRQVAFALACAHGAVGRDSELLGAVDSGWDALVDGGDVSALLSAMEARHDLDEDSVAATYFALSCFKEVDGAAWWAASRAMDQAFARVDYPEGEVALRPVEADAQSDVVQAEIARQIGLLAFLETTADVRMAAGILRRGDT